MKQKLLILFALLLIGISSKVQAYSFSAVAPSGQTLYYNITGTNTAEVTSELASSPYNITKPTGVLIIPDSLIHGGITYSVTSIGIYAFYRCAGLTTITIPNSVTSIGSLSFYNCTSLATITIPNSVTSIGSSTFSGCTSLTSITIPNSVTSIGISAFYNCKSLTTITIPNSVTSIESSVFSLCTGLTTITIPNSVTSIGYCAFYNCSGLTTITIPNSVSSIGDCAFYGCSSLTSITIPNSVTSIGNSVFRKCSGLTSITIPNSVASIGNYAFSECSGLTSVIIGNAVNSIGSYAFSSCGGLTSVTIPNFVTTIQSNAFSECSGLISITIPNSVTSIGNSTFANCNSLTSITIPNSVISIGDYAFQSCSGLTSITISNSITSIGISSFNGCTGLTSITIPNSVTSIGNSAFRSCISLTSISIPNSVTSIGDWAFYYCIGLTSITCKAINPPSIGGSNTFTNVTKTIPVYVLCEAKSKYKSVAYWNTFTNYIGDSYIEIYYDTICKGQTFNKLGFNFTADTTGTYIQTLQNILGCDSIIQLNLFVKPSYNYTTNASICKGQRYTLNGFNTDTAGLFTQNLQTINGCDSIVKLNLKVNPIYYDTIKASICQGQTYTLNGFNQNTTGIYTRNLQTKYTGCDSIVTLNLTVNPTYKDTIYASICYGQTYTSNGFNLNATGIYTKNLKTINGCDSIVSLKLTVNPIYNYTINASICKGQSYAINGFNTDTAGLFTQNLQTIKGCDSIVKLNLKVNPTYNDTIKASICQGQTYTLNGFNQNITGIYTRNLQTKYTGCDSIVTLDLTVNPTYLTTYYDTICKGQIYYKFGFNFTADTIGLYIQSLQTIKGCDSIVKLNLVVNPIYNYTINASICKGQVYTQNGFNVDSTGLFTQNLQTINGCDSIVKLDLIVNPVYINTITASICQGETYTLYGFNRNTSGIYTKSLQTQYTGCDSTITLNLTVNPIYNDTIKASICQGQVYNENGFNVDSTGVYTQHLQTIKSCDSIVTLILSVVNPPKQDIDMVTVDNSNHNVILWNKKEVVNHYNIYREGVVMGQFDLIATVPYDSLGIYTDTNSNPTVKAYMYKVSATDTCTNESELSSSHKTMHLTIGQGMGNNWNLNWTPYEGTNYTTYNIYRGINYLDSLEYLTTISASNTSYTDINVPTGYVYYQVEIIIDTIQSKAGGNNSIRSNYATNKIVSIDGVQTDNFTTILYPNPTNGKAKLEVEGLNSEADVLVYDMFGRVIQRHKINKVKNELEIDLVGYAKGVYTIRIVNDSITQTKKLVVE